MFLKKRIRNDEQLDRVAKLFLVSRFCGSLYFGSAIWYGFATQAITPVQVGLFFSLVGISQFIAEVPTGVVADKHSRKLSALIGTAILVTAPLLIYFGHTFPAYVLAALLYGIGRAFMSGSLDSLVYDHKNVSKETYRRISNLEVTCTSAALILSAAIGGLLFSVHQSLPFVFESIAGVVCFALILQMQEHKEDAHTTPSASYVAHFWQGIRLLLATRYLQVFVLMAIPVWVMLRVCIQFVNEAALISHGFTPSARGLLSAAMTSITLFIVQLVLFKVLKKDRARILFISFGLALAFTLLSVNVLAIFMLGLLLWNFVLGTHSSFIKPILQDGLPSSHRSTGMSGFAALASLVGFGGSVLVGWIVDITHNPQSAYMAFAGVSLIIMAPCAWWLANHLRKNAERS